jgi:hypothetical protein
VPIATAVAAPPDARFFHEEAAESVEELNEDAVRFITNNCQLNGSLQALNGYSSHRVKTISYLGCSALASSSCPSISRRSHTRSSEHFSARAVARRFRRCAGRVRRSGVVDIGLKSSFRSSLHVGGLAQAPRFQLARPITTRHFKCLVRLN